MSEIKKGDDHFEKPNQLNTACLGQFEKVSYLNISFDQCEKAILDS
jgi:hypothetical protein